MWNSDAGPAQDDVHRIEHAESDQWRQAEAFRKTGIFGRAAKYFRRIWDDSGEPEAGWRYAHCLRKTGYQEVAIALLAELHRAHPQSSDITSEYVWALYDGRLVKAKEKGHAAELVDAAKEIVGAGAEGTALKLAVFAVVGAAKTKGQWSQVSNWCDLLIPGELSNVTRNADGKSIPSDRERWYYGKLKALVKLGDWHLAARVSAEACLAFPANESFQRWRAQAIAGLGDYPRAIEILQQIGPKKPWYALADLARFHFALELVEDAWTLACQAARAPGQVQAKVNLWGLMAKVALALTKGEAAYDHLGLELRVRHEQKWPLRPVHLEMSALVRQGHDRKDFDDLPSREWLKRCKKHWHRNDFDAPMRQVESNNTDESLSDVSPKKREFGWFTGWDGKRSFAFIEPKDGQEQVFVLVKDIPDEAQRNRAFVSYITIHHFDKKKNRQSLRAVSVEAAEPEDGEWSSLE